jgi:hypothetical protein
MLKMVYGIKLIFLLLGYSFFYMLDLNSWGNGCGRVGNYIYLLFLANAILTPNNP